MNKKKNETNSDEWMVWWAYVFLAVALLVLWLFDGILNGFKKINWEDAIFVPIVILPTIILFLISFYYSKKKEKENLKNNKNEKRNN